ncbi:MAG TPA: SPOR domain-containing protein [Gemmatimonadaceae bacterium]|nr:SPOR domain-containing protein [Gemmatimonadaceae bacterium]
MGGTGRVYVYPKLDSAVWDADEIPALDRVLAFDESGGTVAYVDSKGFPGRIDLRETDVTKASRAKLTSLSSANGSDIYGINSKGEIVRLNPTGGDWHFKPPVPARSVFAQPNGELIVTANKGTQTLVWRVRPPDDIVLDSTVLPLSGRGVRTSIGDRIYFAVDSGLIGIKAKDLSPVGTVELESRVRALAPTPSGDRLYVATMADSGISIVDRYSGKVGMGVVLPAPPADLRMDALGRYLLARFPKGDSAWVIAIGTNRLVGAVHTRWETDLPAIAPDGKLAVLQGKDVVILDPEKLEVLSTVAGAAKDFWYFFAWDGFRPRARGLDQPVTFGDSGSNDSLAASSTSSAPPESPTTPGAADTAAPPPTASAPASGFTVQFAALLTDDKAQQIASTIRVGATPAHVVSSSIGGSPIFRVIMGPFTTKEEAERVGRAAKHEYWVYEGSP